MKTRKDINDNHASPYLWISAEKDPRSAELRRTFCDVEFRRKNIFSAEILGKTIESAEVHYTKPEDEFRWGMGLNTKFRREKKKSAEVRYTICVVEFRWKLKYTKVRIFFCNQFGGTGSQFSAEKTFFSRKFGILCPIIGRKEKKSAKSAEVCLAKKIWDFSSKFWALSKPYLLAICGTCDREELSWVTVGKSCGLGDGRYNHPLPWSCPMFLQSSAEHVVI